MAITPKKSANDHLFCFTQAVARSRLPPGYEFGRSRLSLALGGAGTGLF
jgi:hypothetical protein